MNALVITRPVANMASEKYRDRGKSDEFEHAIDTNIRKLVNSIRSKYLSTNRQITPIDMAEKLRFLALDISSTMGLGQSFGLLSSDQDVKGYASASQKGLLVGAAVMVVGFG